MNPYIKIVVVLALFMTGFVTGVGVARNHYTAKIAVMEKERAQQNEAIAETITKQVQDNSIIVTKLGVDHANNKNAIDDLFTVVAASRVPLPMPVCPAVTEAGAATGSNDDSTRDRIFLETAQRAFDDFEKGVATDFRYADELNEIARVNKLYILGNPCTVHY